MTQELVPPEHFATFGQLLRYLRKRARLTLRALSIATGYSEGHLANLERDARRPDVATVQARLLPALELDDAPAWAARLLDLASMAGQSAPDRIDSSQASSRTELQPHSVSAPPFDLLATKLFAPLPRPNSVPRPRLLAQLDRALTVRLTLVAAPAGAGKTTLLADWRRHVQSSKRSDMRTIAWLSLDADDNDMTTFVRYLVAACQRLAPHAGAAVLALLSQAPRLTPAELLRPLLNDLAAMETPSVLILDDCHILVERTVQATLMFFVEHLPPQLHLVITSREDPPLPLARLRARGELAEIRARDLRFTTAESDEFLRTTMDVKIAPEHVAALEVRTEGWVAGLQLAALALHDQPDQADIVADLSATSRYLVDYLSDEVLDSLPRHLRTFVLQTSLLDRMCGELCDTVVIGTGDEQLVGNDAEQATSGKPQAAQAYSQHILSELERRHLFIVPLDQQRHWYRYHQLFADVLRSKVRATASASQIATLYRRASHWHEQHGLIGEAIRYALEAGQPSEAVRIVEQRAAMMIEQSAYGELRQWLALLPETIILARPRLYLAQSIVLMVVDPARVEPFLKRVAQLRQGSAQTADRLAAPDSAVGGPTWLDDVPVVITVIRAILARGDREYEHANTLLEQALADMGPSFTYLRGRALLQLGIVHLLRGALSSAEALFRSLVEATEHTAVPSVLIIEAVTWLGEVLTIRGRLHEAAALYERMIAQSEQPQLPVLSRIHMSLGDLYYEWNDLARADDHLQRGFDLGERLASIPGMLRGYTSRARLELARGDLEAARAAARKAQELLEILGTMTSSLRSASLGKILLALGDVTAAQGWAQRRGLRPAHNVMVDTEQEQLALVRVLLTYSDWEAVHELTGRLLARAEIEERMNTCIEVLILQALAHLAQRQRTEALVAMTRALELAAPGGYIRVFIDEGAPMAELLQDVAAQGLMPAYLQTLLAAFPNPGSQTPPRDAPHPQPLTEPLSERELEVLRLVAAGHSNRAIATALTIEVGAVKRHIHSVLGKLGAPSRTAAVARAQALGLI
jgi:LuxR family maltose regulon positive regulatory protein